MPRYTIDLLKAHVRSLGYVQHTGIQHDPNKMLHIKGIYVSFVCAHLDYFCKNYGYTLRRAEPGQKAKIFAPFRDEWLPVALREIRAEDTGKPVSQIEETTYKYKKNQLLSTKQGCIQGVTGWVDTRHSHAASPEGSLEEPALQEPTFEELIEDPLEDEMKVDNTSDPSLISTAQAMLLLSEFAESC